MVKKVGHCVYLHYTNIEELIDYVDSDEWNRVMEILFDYIAYPVAVIKYNLKTQAISLIQSPNWDTANEPDVGDGIKILKSGEVKSIKAKGQVYHNKWQFVGKNYRGFDIQKAKKRTQLWSSIPEVKSVKNKIGYKKFWLKFLEEHNLER
jgi:hypothetical protein